MHPFLPTQHFVLVGSQGPAQTSRGLAQGLEQPQLVFECHRPHEHLPHEHLLQACELHAATSSSATTAGKSSLLHMRSTTTCVPGSSHTPPACPQDLRHRVMERCIHLQLLSGIRLNTELCHLHLLFNDFQSMTSSSLRRTHKTPESKHP